TFARIRGRAAEAGDVEAASWACIRRGRELRALELEAAAAVVNSTSRRWGAFLDQHDVFLCPTAPTAATASGVPNMDDERIDSAGAWIDELFDRSPFTPLANVTG